MKPKTKLDFEQRAELERVLEFSCDEEELSEAIAELIDDRDRFRRMWRARPSGPSKGTTT